MARKALKISCQNRKKEYLKALSFNKKAPFSTRVYNRCHLCGRSKGFMRRFAMCRICFREQANQGFIMGVRKSSW